VEEKVWKMSQSVEEDDTISECSEKELPFNDLK